MKLDIITIVLDGIQFLPMQLNTFNRLDRKEVDWTLHIVEGAAANTGSTRWCKPQRPRLSRDGTTEFLRGLSNHPRVRLYQSPWWKGGKDEMVNAPLSVIREPTLLMQVDVDEIWSPEEMRNLGWLMYGSGSNSARVKMNYFVGPNIVTITDNAYGNNPGEWLRAWSFEPGMKFTSHEPPVLDGVDSSKRCVTPGLSLDHGICPNHYAYVFEKQVAYKMEFYGYANAVEHWKRLQAHRGPWPVKLKDYLPWVDDRAEADLFVKP